MTLNASGPISLAGSVTGESIAVELSQSPFASISLNDTNVRSLAGVASGAIIMPTDFWGKSSGTAWISYKNPSGTYTNVQMGNFYYNSNNNKLYITAIENPSTGVYQSWLAEYNTNGTCNWTRLIQLSTGALSNSGMSFDSSNNIYVACTARYNSTRGRPGVAKFDSSGNFISCCHWTWTNATSNISGDSAFFNNNYVYSQVGGQPPAASSNRYLCRWDPSLNASVTTIMNGPPSGNVNSFAPLFKKYNSNDFYTAFANNGGAPPTTLRQNGYGLISNSTFQSTNSWVVGSAGHLATTSPGPNTITQNTTNGNMYTTILATSAAPVPSKLIFVILNENLGYISSHYYAFTNPTSPSVTNFYANNYWYSVMYDGSFTFASTAYILKIDPSTGNIVSNWKCTLKNSGGTFIANVALTIQNVGILSDGLFNFYLFNASTNSATELFISSDSMLDSLTFVNPQNSAQFYVFEPGGLSTTKTSYTQSNGTNTTSTSAPFGYSTTTQGITTNTPVSSITIQADV
jgi:hypothetical protein